MPARKRAGAGGIGAFVPAFGLALAAPLGGQEPPDPSPVDALLRLHHEQRVAHVLDDAPGLVAPLADTFLEISGGRVRSVQRTEMRTRFDAYLDRVDFVEWEDVRPPRIHLSADSSGATIHVEKRVRLLNRAGGAESARFAWTESWRRGADGWRMASLTSTQDAGAGTAVAESALRAAHRTLGRARVFAGGEVAVARVAMLSADLACEGPRGGYRMDVASARDGRVRFRQRLPDRDPVTVGVSLLGPWRGGGSDSVSGELLTTVRAHEFALLALAPESRYRAPSADGASGTGRFGGRETEAVRFLDDLDDPVVFHYDSESGAPLGYRLAPAGETVEVHLGDWRPVGDVSVPHEVRFVAADGTYRCRAEAISTAWVPASGFDRPGR